MSGAALAAATTTTLDATQTAQAGDPSFMNNSFMNNVPDPLLAGKKLPTFKFALEKIDRQSHPVVPTSRYWFGSTQGVESSWRIAAIVWAIQSSSRLKRRSSSRRVRLGPRPTAR